MRRNIASGYTVEYATTAIPFSERLLTKDSAELLVAVPAIKPAMLWKLILNRILASKAMANIGSIAMRYPMPMYNQPMPSINALKNWWPAPNPTLARKNVSPHSLSIRFADTVV